MFALLGLGSMIWLMPWLSLVKNDERQIEKSEMTAAAMPFGRILASPVIWGTIIGTFCYMYFVYFCMTWMPAYFTERRHLPIDKMGLYMLFSFGGMAAVATGAGWAADRLIAGGRDPVFIRKAFIIAGFLMASTEV